LEIDAEIYHFHDPELLRIAIKLKRKGKKVIYDIHEDLPRAIMSKQWISSFIRKPLSMIIERYENKVAKKMDCLMTATPYITQRFKQINSNTININNYPVLEELIDNTKEEKQKKKQVCYVGGINEIRGIYELYRAANFLNG